MNYININRIIPDLIERTINCTGLEKVYALGADDSLETVFGAINIEYINHLSKADGDGLLFISIDDFDWNDLLKYTTNGLCILKTRNTVLVPDECNGIVYDFSNIIEEDETRIVLMGAVFSYKPVLNNPDFKVLAIMHVYNEVDILEQTIQYLLGQGIDVYIVDNWSSDGSFEIASKLKNEYPDRLYLERFPLEGYKESHKYEWYKQLTRTEEISKQTEYDWYIHYDVDEIRVSPWKNVTLKDAFCYIDSLGYNCVENTVIDFRLTDMDEEIFNKNAFFEMRVSIYTEQLKSWKKDDLIDLKESAGHKVHMANPRVFPLKILNKHFPMRSVRQASKKIFQERQKDYSQEEKKEKGWHTQYDRLKNEDDLIYDKSDLLYWDDSAYEKYYITLFSECGLDKNRRTFGELEPDIQGKRLLIYGAGVYGEYVISALNKNNTILGWFDKAYEYLPHKYGKIIQNPAIISDEGIDYIVIAIRNEKVRSEIKDYLLMKGIREDKLIYVSNRVVS